MPVSSSIRSWLFAAVLYLPVVCFYAAHYAVGTTDPAQHPTGFVQYDQPYYLANARQYVDGATDGLRYASPFSCLEAPEPIYFQPQVAVLALLWKWTGCDPGLLFVLFGAVFGMLCIHCCLRVLSLVLPQPAAGHGSLALLFLWGGGILFLVGTAYGLFNGNTWSEALANGFRFDPAGGWWFLNLGRNLVYPLEAYYHFLYFALLLALMEGKHVRAIAWLALLVASHPFTGTAAALVVVAWCCTERWLLRNAVVPAWVPFVVLGVLLTALYYYGIALPRNAEHASLMAQWTIAWKEDLITILCAYGPVAALVVWRMRSLARARTVLAAPRNRLLLALALITFALENHDLLMEPVQPLHFSRGYTWSALFLLGVPVLSAGRDRLRTLGKPQRSAVIAAVTVLLLVDNGAWMGVRTRANLRGAGENITLSDEQRELYAWLNTHVPANTLLVANDPLVAYLALVYTPHRAYYSHHFNTPQREQRRAALEAYFNGTVTDVPLQEPHITVVDARVGKYINALGAIKVFEQGPYSVYRTPSN